MGVGQSRNQGPDHKSWLSPMYNSLSSLGSLPNVNVDVNVDVNVNVMNLYSAES